MQKLKYIAFAFVFMISATIAHAQVLGSCGSGAAAAGAKAAGSATVNQDASPPSSTVSNIPLPGQPAIDFELPAVVKDEIKTVKLSDYSGKYRVLCFFPAAFTFV